MTPELIIAIVWVACGVAAYGIVVADYVAYLPENQKMDYTWIGRIVGMAALLIGPVALVVLFFHTLEHSGRPFKHRWRL